MTFAKSKELFLHITNVATSHLRPLKWVLDTYALKDATYYSLKTVKTFFNHASFFLYHTVFIAKSIAKSRPNFYFTCQGSQKVV